MQYVTAVCLYIQTLAGSEKNPAKKFQQFWKVPSEKSRHFLVGKSVETSLFALLAHSVDRASMCVVCFYAVVGVAPQFSEKLHSQRVREGGSARFVARVGGNPPPEVTWYREGVQITSSPDFIISSEGDVRSLTISEVFREDAGKFSARATNPLGQVQCVAELIVERMSAYISLCISVCLSV